LQTEVNDKIQNPGMHSG